MKTAPYEVVFGVKPSLEPEPTLKVVDEPADDSEDDTDLEEQKSLCMGGTLRLLALPKIRL